MAPLNPLAAAKTVVIKIGSALLVDAASGGLRAAWLGAMAEDVAMLRARGQRVAVVSSGAIALGRGLLGLPKGALSLEQSQAAAAAGQIGLARAYAEALAPHGIIAAQVLLTLDDTRDRRRYLNGRATMDMLLGLGAVPVVNENDTVATDEIRYGDNDRLAARVALMAGAEALVLLSDVDGLFTANPALDPSAQRLPVVEDITPEIEAMAGDPVSGLSKGGMRTKILAAKTAVKGGCAMAITRGEGLRPIRALEQGAPCTWFLPRETPASARKQWIAGLKTVGALIVDAGAAAALRSGKSLLPAGVRGVDGVFERGDPVMIRSQEGGAVGLGLVGYSSVEGLMIAGRRTDQIEAALGHPGRAAMIHRDDMVVWG